MESSVANFTFYTDDVTCYAVELKNGDKHYFVEGYASTPDIDLVNDIITPEGLKSMLEQIKTKNIKIDVEHESWTPGGSPNIIPTGKVVDARIDAKGLWIKAQLNSGVDRFQSVWKSLKDGFIDAFSIAFTNVKAIEKKVNGVTARIISDLDLLNIALTGNPANPHCRISEVMAKSKEFAKIMEEQKMAEEQPTAPATEASAPVAAPEVKSVSVDDFEQLKKELAELKSVSEKNNAELKSQLEQKEKDLKSLNEQLNAIQLKSQAPIEKPEAPATSTPMIGPLDFISNR